MSTAAFYQAFVEIVPEAKNLRKSLSKEFGTAGPSAGRAAGKGINEGVLGSVGKLAGPLAAAFAAVGIGSIIKDSIGNASDFAESATAISAVFGDADKTIQKFAAGSAAALGQSTNQTLDAARVFGVFGKSAGLSGEDLAGFSTEFITLAGDLASFNNTTPEEAIEALGSGLRGEAEPLRKYGVLLDDAALKARATEMGIYSGTGALTAQQKVLASQAEIMAQTGIAQGDFAKTSGGLANQQRILSAGLTNLSTTFGAMLLPVMTTVVGAMNRSLIPALGLVIEGISGVKSILIDGDFTGAFGRAFDIQEDSKIVDYLFRIREGVLGLKAFIFEGDFTGDFRSAFHVEEDSPIVDFLFTVRESFGKLGTVFGPLISQLLTLWQSFSPLSMIFQAIGPMLPQIVDALVGLAVVIGGALGAALSDMLPTITEFSGMLVGLIGGLVTMLLPIILDLVGIIGPLLGAVLTAVVPLFTSLMGVVMQLVAAIMPLLAPILALIVPLAQLIAAILPPLISLFVAILTPIIALASLIIAVLVPVLQVIIGVLSAVIGWIAQVLTFFVQLVTGTGDAGKKFGEFFAGIPQMILDSLGNMGEFLVNAGADLIQGFIDGITGMLDGVGEAIGGVMDFVGGFFPHSPAQRGPFSGSGWNAVKNAGLAIGDQFGVGLSDAEPGFNAELGSLVGRVASPKLDASVYGSASVGGAGSSPRGLALTQNISTIHGQSNAEIAHIAANDLNASLRGF